MRFCLSVSLIFLAGINFVFGKISPLLVTTIGEGVVQVGSKGAISPLASSQFLPKSAKLSVRPKSGPLQPKSISFTRHSFVTTSMFSSFRSL